jgi:hypothetical protein
MGDAGHIPFAKLGSKPGQDKITGLDRIFFWSLPGDTAGENRQLVKLSLCTSCKLG